jgi:hypothetical protein
MLSTRFAAALFGAGALLATGLSLAPAAAAPVAAGTAAAASAEAGLVQQAWHRGRPHDWADPRPYYRRPVYRPRCYFVDRRVWNGYRWVIRSVRVCR